MNSDSGSDRQAKTPQAVEGEASQSGPKGIAQPVPPSPTAEVELLPCPFCGGEGVKCFHVDGPVRTRHWVLCRDCHACPGDKLSEAAASTAWNTRTPQQTEAVEACIADVWRQAEDNHRRYSDMGDHESEIRFLALGLTGEAGELANFVKKRWRDGDDHDEDIRKEIADVCAYAFMLASTMGMSPPDLISTIAAKQQVFIAKMKVRDCLHPYIDSSGYCHDCRRKPFAALSPIKGDSNVR